jgi:hypothetical protein
MEIPWGTCALLRHDVFPAGARFLRHASPALLLLAFAAVAVLVRWVAAAVTGITFEDSLISLRYAENLASGHGMVYNPGERVFGASTPLYVLFLAGLARMGLPALGVAKALAALSDGVTLYLWGRWLFRVTGGGRAPLWFSLLFGLSPVIVLVSVSGMETSFALLLLSLAVLWTMEEREGTPWERWRVGLALGLLMLVRPDGAIAAVVLLGHTWWRTRRIPWRAALLAATILLPWLATAIWYYGTPIPNSIPAKAAAYNLHRSSALPNLWATLALMAPIREPWGRLLTNALLFPFLIVGVARAWRTPTLRPLALLFGAWWAYLVLPRTMLFPWYYPLLTLPVYVLSALGFGATPATHAAESADATPAVGRLPRPTWSWAVVALLAVGLLGYLHHEGQAAQRVQRAELAVRKQIGLWLRENTGAGVRVALEPIGYVGYYSGRRILDEVGLVSPEMIPLNREGAGWFGRMLKRHRPDYVVERPSYLVRNETLLTGVPMFASKGEREAFVAEYEPAAAFSTTGLPPRLARNYRFVVFARRTPESARAWRELRARLPQEERTDLLYRALTGTVALPRDPFWNQLGLLGGQGGRVPDGAGRPRPRRDLTGVRLVPRDTKDDAATPGHPGRQRPLF